LHLKTYIQKEAIYQIIEFSKPLRKSFIINSTIIAKQSFIHTIKEN